MAEDIATLKARLRQQAYGARKAAFAKRAARNAVAQATEALLQEIGPADGLRISGYMPIRSELDPLPAMAALHHGGAQIGVPVIAGRDLPLDFRAWTPEAVMVDGPFGALVPEAGDWVDPDLLIVPLVGFDGRCHRLGYGGGYYDRSLDRLRARRPTRAIGFAFAAQQLPDLPLLPTDQALDAIVTEAGIWRPSPLAAGAPTA